MFLWARPRLGVVEFTGLLGGGPRLMTYIRLLEGLRRSRRVKGVVLEIDSPGGLVTASDYLFTTASRLASQKEMTSPISTRHDGTSVRRPLTWIWPWWTIWRAWARESARPRR